MNLHRTMSPSERLEDIYCAIDYLTTLPMVDVERIGLLGVCAEGSYVLAKLEQFFGRNL